MKCASAETIPDAQLAYKIVVCGAARSGKTALVQRYARGVFVGYDYAPTVGLDCALKSGVSRSGIDGGAPFAVAVWELGGDECSLGSLARSRIAFRGAAGAAIAFDVCDATSLDAACDWLVAYVRRCTDRPDFPFVLVGTHSDAPRPRRQVSFAEAQMRAAQAGAAAYCEVSSAVSQRSVDAAFDELLGAVAGVTRAAPRHELLVKARVNFFGLPCNAQARQHQRAARAGAMLP